MNTISAPLPAEIAALGTPDQVFQPAVVKKVPLPAVFCIVTGILGFALTGFFATGIGGPGGNIVAGAAIVFGLMSLIITAWGVWLTSGGAHCSQTYLLYEDVLAELFPTRHRIIPWSDVGATLKPAGPVIKEYDFPVRDGKPLRFDFTMPEHDALAKAIVRQRLLWALGGEAALEELATGAPAPFFLAYATRFMIPHTYRVSYVGENLLLLFMGTGRTTPPEQDGATLPLSYAFKATSYELFKMNMKRVEGFDERALFDFACQHAHSILISGRGLSDVSFVAPTVWNGGALQLSHATEGELTFEFHSADDAVTAAELTKTRLGTLSAAL